MPGIRIWSTGRCTCYSSAPGCRLTVRPHAAFSSSSAYMARTAFLWLACLNSLMQSSKVERTLVGSPFMRFAVAGKGYESWVYAFETLHVLSALRSVCSALWRLSDLSESGSKIGRTRRIGLKPVSPGSFQILFRRLCRSYRTNLKLCSAFPNLPALHPWSRSSQRSARTHD